MHQPKLQFLLWEMHPFICLFQIRWLKGLLKQTTNVPEGSSQPGKLLFEVRIVLNPEVTFLMIRSPSFKKTQQNKHTQSFRLLWRIFHLFLLFLSQFHGAIFYPILCTIVQHSAILSVKSARQIKFPYFFYFIVHVILSSNWFHEYFSV